jgi:hypothetical protein
MKKYIVLIQAIVIVLTISVLSYSCKDRGTSSKIKVIAFHDGEHDQAHVSFVREADKWFTSMAEKHNFIYESTNDWNNLNSEKLSNYDVLIFLDSRPDSAAPRAAFQKYMENGGAWMGFHFAAFALTPSAYPQNWDWYHEEFLGAGQYKSNTWRPTSAILRVENRKHPATKNLPDIFKASANEWYRWEKDLRQNPDIEILVSIDSTSFPLGTGPKLHEIWHSGYYPVVWTNKNFRMLYLNMGHNDIDYENKTNADLSKTFDNEIQNRLVLDGLFWLAKKEKK